MFRTLGVISCGASKRDGTHPAFDLYVGNYFTAMRDWALTHVDRADLYIVSAKYGLLHADDPVEFYNVKLTDKAAQTQHEFLKSVRARDPRLLSARVMFFGSALYFARVKYVWENAQLMIPDDVRSKGMGTMIQYARQQTKERLDHVHH